MDTHRIKREVKSQLDGKMVQHYSDTNRGFRRQENASFLSGNVAGLKRSLQYSNCYPSFAKRRKIGVQGLSFNQGQSWWRFGAYERKITQQLIRTKNPTPGQTINRIPPNPTSLISDKQITNKEQHIVKPTSTLVRPTIIRQDAQDHLVSDLDDEASSDNNHGNTQDESGILKFRAYQAENWTEKFEELLEFRSRLGHCLVPNAYEENPPLAQWVKRQRYQYKLKKEGKRSTMSDERIQALEEVGFVWDSHSAAWEERLEELIRYKALHGHCNVPSRYAENRQLAIWVKRQRRQYKFFFEGSPSSMTETRISTLEALGFQWDMRGKR